MRLQNAVLGLLDEFGHTEVCNFVHAVVDENVGWLQIPVDDVKPYHFLTPC